MADTLHGTDWQRGGQLHFWQIFSSLHLTAVVVTVYVVAAAVILIAKASVADIGAVGRMLAHSLRMM